MKKSKKGYVLLITILITFFITSVSLIGYTYVYRYNIMMEKNKSELQERVK